MGLVQGAQRATVIKPLEPVLDFDVKQVRTILQKFEEICPTPALWERAFYELLDCFPSPEACARAFQVLDADQDGLIDARETLGVLAILCQGHLEERLTLLFDIFDLNKDADMAFDEAFLMLRRTVGGLRKFTGVLTPPEQVLQSMVKQIWKVAKKHRDIRITHQDWRRWWSLDSVFRNAVKPFIWKAEDQRGLPTPDLWSNIDYTKGVAEIQKNDAEQVRIRERKIEQVLHISEAPEAAAISGSGVGGPSATSESNPTQPSIGMRDATAFLLTKEGAGNRSTFTPDYDQMVLEGQQASPFAS